MYERNKVMKLHTKYHLPFIMILGMGTVLFMIFSCDTNYPDDIFNPNDTGGPYPVINSVDPSSYFLSGSGDTCRIYGENFVPGPDSSHVYFGNSKAIIISVTENLIELYPPIIDAVNVPIKVDVFGAYPFAEYSPYTLERVAIEYGGLSDVDQVLALTCDKNENLFLAMGTGSVIAIDPSQGKTYLTRNGSTSASAIKVGPDSTLYYALTKYIYKMSLNDYYTDPTMIDPNTVTPELYNAGQAVKQKINDFDLDADGNFYCAGKSGITFLTAAGTKPFDYAASYGTATLYGIKVIDDYVYVASREQIWRNQILDANGTLGSNEDVYTFDVAGEEILSFNISKDGNLYIGCDSLTATSQALYKVEPNTSGDYTGQTANPLYSTALLPPSSYLCWGNDDYLYINRASSTPAFRRVIRVNMREKGQTILWK